MSIEKSGCHIVEDLTLQKVNIAESLLCVTDYCIHEWDEEDLANFESAIGGIMLQILHHRDDVKESFEDLNKGE